MCENTYWSFLKRHKKLQGVIRLFQKSAKDQRPKVKYMYSVVILQEGLAYVIITI